jgi:Fe-S-cluster-containing hydrogenase component 2
VELTPLTTSEMKRNAIELDNIVNSGYCLGCGLCASLAPQGAIQMSIGSDGFITPNIVNKQGVDLSCLGQKQFTGILNHFLKLML